MSVWSKEFFSARSSSVPFLQPLSMPPNLKIDPWRRTVSLPADVASRAQMMNAKEKKEKREASIFVSSWARHAAAGGERHPLRERKRKRLGGKMLCLDARSLSLSMIISVIIDVDPWSLTGD